MMMLTETYTAVICRKALMPGGLAYRPDRVIPSDLAFVECGSTLGGHRIVTWDEVHRLRRERQADRLLQKRSGECEWRPYKIWVAYFDQWLMGGWQAFIENRDDCHWIDRDRRLLMRELMQVFPLVLPLEGERERWEDWKLAFAEQFKRRTHDRRPLGVAYVWWNGRDFPRRF